MYGTSVEHHALYQYQFEGTKEVLVAGSQTETAYWQPDDGGYRTLHNGSGNGQGLLIVLKCQQSSQPLPPECPFN